MSAARPHQKCRFILPKEEHGTSQSQSQSASASASVSASADALAEVSQSSKTLRQYKCAECPAKFVAFRQLKQHERTHTDSADVLNVCNYCCCLYANAELLEQHLADSHADKLFLCRPCQKRYTTRGHLLHHVARAHHTDVLPYYCSLCPTTPALTSRRTLQQHFQELHVLVPSARANPDVDEDEEEDLRMNVEFLDEFLFSVTNDSSFQFSECWEALDLHFEDMLHPAAGSAAPSDASDTTATYKCPKCSRSCSNLKLLLLHLAERHAMPVLFCGKCDAAFKDLTALAEHKSARGCCSATLAPPPAPAPAPSLAPSPAPAPATSPAPDPVEYECPYCGKPFGGGQSLKRHLRIVHSQVKRHVCQLCDGLFATLDHLKKHVLSRHQNDRKHICHVCAKRFTQLCHLKQHIAIHTNGKAVDCALCQATFWKKIDLKRHLLAEHGGKTK